MYWARKPDIGMPTTMPAYEPLNAIVAKRDLSCGGAQKRQIPWQAGYTTPWNAIVYLNFQLFFIEIAVLTSTKPCITRMISKNETLFSDIAPGMVIFRTADVQIAKPKIRLAGKTDARKPPGICVIRYPQKNDESTILSVAASQWGFLNVWNHEKVRQWTSTNCIIFHVGHRCVIMCKSLF